MLTSSNQKSKKVAVLGCSHSDFQIFSEQGYWVKFMSDKFPNIHFDNYSHGGTGNQLIELNFKYALYEDITEYDCIIVQLSHHLRWMTPTTGWSQDFFYDSTEKAYDEFNEEFGVKFNNITKKRLNLPFAYGTDNISRTILESIPNVHISNRAITRRYVEPPKINKNWEEKEESQKTRFMSSNRLGTDLLNLSSINTKLFNKQLQQLSKDNSIFYFNWWPQTLQPGMESNIDRLCVIDWFNENHPNWMKDMIDDTAHLTFEGNQILWNEYFGGTALYERLVEISQ